MYAGFDSHSPPAAQAPHNACVSAAHASRPPLPTPGRPVATAPVDADAAAAAARVARSTCASHFCAAAPCGAASGALNGAIAAGSESANEPPGPPVTVTSAARRPLPPLLRRRAAGAGTAPPAPEPRRSTAAVSRRATACRRPGPDATPARHHAPHAHKKGLAGPDAKRFGSAEEQTSKKGRTGAAGHQVYVCVWGGGNNICRCEAEEQAKARLGRDGTVGRVVLGCMGRGKLGHCWTCCFGLYGQARARSGGAGTVGRLVLDQGEGGKQNVPCCGRLCVTTNR
eukprot:364532-Chlamydomonas_euryale.AAC.8